MRTRSVPLPLALATLSALVSFGCALLGEVGGGALEALHQRVYTEGDSAEWGRAWDPEPRGVGVAPRAATLERVDCAGIADEFDALYVGDVLRNPRRFVSTLDGALSRERYEALPRDALRLSGSRSGGVIAVVHTTEGNRAKLVARWIVGDSGAAMLRIQDLVVYGASGDERLRVLPGPVDVPPRVALDLDPAGADATGYDLLYGPDPGGRMVLRSAEGAGIAFPSRSLCSARAAR